MGSNLVELSGWLPAIIIPVATLSQLLTLIKNRSSANVNVITWSLFGIANLGLYIYVEKYWEFQSLIGLLGSAVIDFLIVAFILINNREHKL